MFENLFLEAYPLAQRAANVHSAAAFRALDMAGLDRQDVAQEVILAVWVNLGRFDPFRASLPTFIERVSATKVASILRRGKAQKRARVDSDSLNIDPMDIRVTVELRVDVRRALSLLSLADQNMARLLLHYKPAEVARKLGCSRAAVYRGIERIRAVLKRLGLEKY
ncbi:MAG: sigma-70 family RNA polymerase sigma factor [Bryobacteraceae bacterium]